MSAVVQSAAVPEKAPSSSEPRPQPAVSFDVGHSDIVHDAQYDYYGRLLATCSSDKSIIITAVAQGAPRHVATLTGHEGPVWMVAWGHPAIGAPLASCSYDQRVIVWKEYPGDQWRPAHIVTAHTSSVNGISWAPHIYGVMLASAGSDGKVFVTSCTNDGWAEPVPVAANVAHPMGAMAVSWAPVDDDSSTAAPLLASGGCDCHVRLWTRDAAKWSAVGDLTEHSDWVRDVAFSPARASPYIVLASCGHDKNLVVRRKARSTPLTEGSWEVSVTPMEEVLWHISWSPCGNMLIVTTAESHSYVMRPGVTFTLPWVKAPVDDA